ncbi:MAG: glycosyltransferase family 2 protein [Pseudomonadota bacterium]
MTERISVIIPVYRSAEMIGDAIASALEQTIPCKVIVVDDASGDGTVAAARAAARGYDCVSILEQSVNQGPAAARNRAIAAADTEFVALLDADDRMSSGRLESMLTLADAHNWDFVADDLLHVTDWSRIEAATRHWSDTDFGEIKLDLAMFVRENMPAYSGAGRELGYIKPIMRRDTLCALDLRYDEGMRLGEDFDLYGRALVEGVSFGMVDPRGYYAFNTPGSLSKRHRADDLRAFWSASRTLYHSPGISDAARSLLKEHVLGAHTRWAWVRLIEAKHKRDPFDALGAFLAPPKVVADLLGHVGEHIRRGRRGASKERQRIA